MKSYENTSELKEFIVAKKLRDQNSNIIFNANIKLETAEHYTEIEKEVMVRFDGYNTAGKLTILESGLDPYEYPEDFDAKWQNFKFLDNEYVQIKGKHPNEKIGNYILKITPIL